MSDTVGARKGAALPPPLLEADGVAKRFGAVTALSDGRLTVRPGEIVALMGANGAGKSTFVKCLTGVHHPDAGTIRVAGREGTLASPAAARAAGLVSVYQEPALIPDLDVADNLRLGQTPVEPFRRWAAELGIENLRLNAMARDLPLATQRVLDLARALAAEPKVLILDEMTAALPTDLVEHVLRVVRAEADAGRGVVYISHRFAEIAQLCDRATVLRDGATVGDLAIEPGVEDKAVEMMLGAALAHDTAAVTARPPGTVRLGLKNIAAAPKLEDVTFDLHEGEVLGVVALEGQGQDELFEVLAGYRRPTGGTLAVEGAARRFRHPADAIALGLALVPGNRADALLSQRSVRENIALPGVARPATWGLIPTAREAERVTGAIERLQIDTRAQGEVQRLSGGNQQKVTIARWVASGARTLLLFDPTRGIDVRTKGQIYPLVRELAEQGAAILFYTSELDEIPRACDRVVVLFKGRIQADMPASEATAERLMRAAHGLAEAA